MLTVLQRPQSCRTTTQIASSITTNGYGTAVLSGGALSDGQRILIINSLDSYNGFWIIDAYGPSQFRLRKYAGGPTLDYTQDASVTILICTGAVEWSCVHLPIVYKLSSNLWPTNASDSIRAVVGFANDNGLVRLTLSGSIDANELDYLNIASTSVSDLDGPFQIITKWSATQFTINAPYALATSPYTYSTATAQKYYNNYHARIRIYGGLNASHLWAGLKPYALLAEYKIVPDEDGEIFLNVAETLKEKINILLNRPNYDSKPYDLDRFAQFYIEYAEVYDVLAVSTVGSYTSDQGTFEGWAADAKLEFKNRYSGFLSDYLYQDSTHLGKFINHQGGVQFNGWYKDVSVIVTPNIVIGSFRLEQFFYDKHGNLLQATGLIYSMQTSEGILRLPLLEHETADYQIIRLADITSNSFSEDFRIDINQNCYSEFIYLTWKNNLGGFEYWLFTGNKDYNINILETQDKDKNPYPDWDKSYGEFADTLSQEVSRRSRNEIVVRSQNLTRQQVEFIKTIKTTAFVWQMTSQYDRRRVKVDATSFIVRDDTQKNAFEIAFRIQYTDEIPSQSL